MKECETHHVTWQCDWLTVKLCITFTREKFCSYDHLEIKAVDPTKHPLPITETGYRSHFEPAGNIDELGGAVEVVRQILDAEAKTINWRQRMNEMKQGSLF